MIDPPAFARHRDLQERISSMSPTLEDNDAKSLFRSIRPRLIKAWEAGALVTPQEDIMRFVFGFPERLDAPVRDAMQTAFISVPKEMPVNSLVSILQVAPYAAVTDGTQFLGIITRTDVLNYLRRQKPKA